MESRPIYPKTCNPSCVGAKSIVEIAAAVRTASPYHPIDASPYKYCAIIGIVNPSINTITDVINTNLPKKRITLRISSSS